jgi:copper chaperone CopZ
MKKLLLAILLIASAPLMAQIKSASLTASGLTCSMCSKAIYKALLKVPEIKGVSVDVEKSVYKVTFKENAKIEIEDVKRAVTDAGFSVASMQIRANFNDVEVSNGYSMILSGNKLLFLAVNKQKLSGEKTVTIVDKGYISDRDFKKYSKTQGPGNLFAQTTTTAAGTTDRVYHVILDSL